MPVVLVLAIAALTALGPGDSAKKTAPETSLPILPTRHTQFTTDEGTWMSLDVSPDGQNVVFDLVGDLYTVPITGGKATRITSGMGFDGQPRYAPDGKSIVYVTDRSGYENLWLVDPDGKNPRALTKDHLARVGARRALPDRLPDQGRHSAMAFLASRALRAMLYGVSASDPLLMAGVPVVFSLVALAATWAPARRAASVDPVVAIKTE